MSNQALSAENPGLIALNAGTIPDQRTIVVVGLPRGGTSLMASTLAHLGLPFDRRPPRYEHVLLKKALGANDWPAFQANVSTMNAKYDVWGWKFAGGPDTLGKAIGLLRNPFIVAVYKDPVALSLRKQALGMHRYSNIIVGINKTLHHYLNMNAALRLVSRPTLFVSYEKTVIDMRLFVQRLASFTGLDDHEALDDQRIAVITKSVSIDQITYRNSTAARFAAPVKSKKDIA